MCDRVYDSSLTKILLSRHARDKREILRNIFIHCIVDESLIGKRQIWRMWHFLTMHDAILSVGYRQETRETGARCAKD